MKVGIVARNFPPYVRGGSALSAYHLAKGLADEGVEVHIFTSSSPQKPEEGMIMKVNLNAKMHKIFSPKIPKNALRRDLMSIEMALQLRKELSGLGKFNILHSYGMDTIPAVWFNKKHSRVVVANANENWATCPFVDHVFNNEYCPKCRLTPLLRCVLSKVPGGFMKRALAFPYFFISIKMKGGITKRLDMLFPISEDMKNRLIQNGFNPKKMRVCYNMVNPKDFEELDNCFLHRKLGLDESVKIILYAGRFAPYKGVEYIMRAVPKVVNKFEDVVFVFLGHGSGKAGLITISRELWVEDRVIFGGMVKPIDMPSAYASAYCVLMPSTWSEPLGRIHIEALASGCAVIATDVGGIPEVVVDGKTGLLIKPFSSDEIANAVMLLLRDEKMRDDLAREGREKVLKKHGMDNQIKNYINSYKNMLGRKK